MEETKALIFDCDGTLTNSMPLHYRAWREVLASINVEFTEKRFYELAGMPSRNVFADVVADDFSEDQIDRLLANRENLFLEFVDEIEPVSAVVGIAKNHKARIPMAVASGSALESVGRQLDVLGIRNWFDAIVTAEDTQRHKPYPDVFLEAARLLDVAPNLCRVYEDSDLGIEAAKRAGMTWVDVRPLY